MPQLPLKTTLAVLMVCAWASDPAALPAEEPMQVDLVQDLHWQDHHFAMTNWFYKYKWSEPATQIDTLSECGYGGAMLSLKDDPNRWKMLPAYLAALEKHNMRLTAIHARFYVEDGTYPQVIKDNLPLLKDSRVVLIPSVGSREKLNRKDPKAIEMAVKILREMSDDAEQYGLGGVAPYMHIGNWIETINDNVRIAQAVDRRNVGVMFHLHHWQAVGNRDFEQLREDLTKAKPYLMIVVIQGTDQDKATHKILGEGSFDMVPLVRTLREIDYQGPLGTMGYTQTGDIPGKLKRAFQAWDRIKAADKTLVSWVILKDKNIRAGSVLTVQAGDQFDGIVFAELAETKWMAGSNHFKRTNKRQEEYPREDADANTLVQMAIVYKGDRITIYRNGKEYVSHKATNIDLLGNEENYVVFGLRHVGGEGHVAALIEDARIYNKALSREEIQSLEPNRESSIKPFAWWDFEGGKMKDRMGQYPHSKLDSGAKLADGKLDLGRNGNVLACPTEEMLSELSGHLPLPPFTGPYVPETPKWPQNPPDNWAIYHLAHPTFTMGSPFDPNPALFYKGRYHLHYIYKNRTGFVFGHVSSKDMVRWKWHPTVLAPPNTGHGMFSGTGFLTKDGEAAAVYHGQGSGRNWIVYARGSTMDEWSTPEVMLPRDEAGNLMENVRYFDPDIWLMDGKYYGLNARSSKEAPTIMKSDNLKDWTFIGELLHPDFDEKKLGVKMGEDISCPNFFKLGNKWVLVCISHRLGCRYFIGDFKNEQFLPEQHALMGGLSNRYFAPESLLTPDGRRVNWAWFFGGQTKGVQALPMEMELPNDGVMRFRPIRELESLRYDEKSCEDVKVTEDEPAVVEKIKGNHIELKVLVEKPDAGSLGVDVLCDEQGRNGLRIGVDSKAGMLLVGNEKAPFQLRKNEPLTLRIFVDTTLVEVFANERQYVITDKPREAGARITDRIALFSLNGDLTVDKITGWQMKSAFEGDTVFKKD